jgi:TPR repeat protein
MRQLTIVLMFTATFLGSTFLHAAELRIVGSQGIEVFLQNGVSCGQKMNIIVRSSDKRVFSGDRAELARVMGGARAVLNSECPQISKLNITGKVDEKVVFIGFMSQEDNWNLVYINTSIASEQDSLEAAINQAQKSKKAELQLGKENLRRVKVIREWIYDHAIVLSDGRHVFLSEDGRKLFDHDDNEIRDRASIEEARRIAGITEPVATPIGNTNTDALLKMADQYSYGKGVQRNYVEAARLYMAAAEAGNAEAQYKLAVSFDKGLGVAPDSQQAIYWFRQAANQGHTGSMSNIGNMYEEGRGFQQSYSEAIKWYSMAAERGNAIAHYNLGVFYEDGKGVPKNINLAIEHFRMAANLGGVPKAQRMLNRILHGRNR